MREQTTTRWPWVFPVGLLLVTVVQAQPSSSGAKAEMTDGMFTRLDTGAKLRSVQDKLSEVLSVKDFGARGDGVSDDTQAVQNAVDAASLRGAVLVFPAGTYRVTRTILITKSDVSLSGPGGLLNAAGSSAPTVHIRGAPGRAVRRTQIVGLRFSSAYSGQGHLVLTHAIESHVVRCVFEKSNGDAITLAEGSWENHIADSVFLSIGGSAITLGTNSNGTVIRQNRMHGCSGSGVKLTGSPIYGVTILGNAIEGNRDPAIRVHGSASVWSLNIVQNYFEADANMKPPHAQIVFERRGTGSGVEIAEIRGNIIDGGNVATVPLLLESGKSIVFMSNHAFRHMRANAPELGKEAAGIILQHASGHAALTISGRGAANRSTALALENTAPEGTRWELSSGSPARGEAVLVLRNASREVDVAAFDPGGRVEFLRATAHARVEVPFRSEIRIDASSGDEHIVTATSASPFRFVAPAMPSAGQRITLRVRNATAKALGAVTFDRTFKMARWDSPAAGFSRAIDFVYDGAAWVETARTPSDVPN